MAATQLKNMSAQHHSLVDFIIENSHEKSWRAKACACFGYSMAYLSIITKSDVFREEYQKRLMNWREGASRELQSQMIAVAKKSYERLLQFLDSDDVDASLALDIANSTMKNLGFAPSPGNAPSVQKVSELTRTETREISPGVLEEARVTYRKVTTGEQLLTAVGE